MVLVWIFTNRWNQFYKTATIENVSVNVSLNLELLISSFIQMYCWYFNASCLDEKRHENQVLAYKVKMLILFYRSMQSCPVIILKLEFLVYPPKPFRKIFACFIVFATCLLCVLLIWIFPVMLSHYISFLKFFFSSGQ